MKLKNMKDFLKNWIYKKEDLFLRNKKCRNFYWSSICSAKNECLYSLNAANADGEVYTMLNRCNEESVNTWTIII